MVAFASIGRSMTASAANCGVYYLLLIHKETGDVMLLPDWCCSWLCENIDCQKYRVEKFFKDWEAKNYKFVGWTSKRDYYSRIKSLINRKKATTILVTTTDDSVRMVISDKDLSGRTGFMRELDSLEVKRIFYDILMSGKVRRTSPGPDNFKNPDPVWVRKGKFNQSESQQTRLLYKAGYKLKQDDGYFYTPEDDDAILVLESLLDD